MISMLQLAVTSMENAMANSHADDDILFIDGVNEPLSVGCDMKSPHEVDVVSEIKYEALEDDEASISSSFKGSHPQNSLSAPEDNEMFIDCVNEFHTEDCSEKLNNHGVDAVSEMDFEYVEASQLSDSSSLTELRDQTSFSEIGEICVGDASDSIDHGMPESAVCFEDGISSLSVELTHNHNIRRGSSSIPVLDKDGGDPDASESCFLDRVAELLMQAAALQLDLIIGLVSSPSSSLHLFDTFLKNPMGTMISGRDYFLRKSREFRSTMLKKLCSSASDFQEESGSVLKISFGLSRALFLSVFASVFMACLLVMSFVLSYLTARIIVVEPVQIKEELYFDFTQRNPVAFAPVIHATESCGMDVGTPNGLGKTVGLSRALSPHEGLLVTISISLPESDYNRNLGVFQIRVEQMGKNGEVVAASSRPSMLPYRSEGIRMVSSYLRMVPVLAGGAAEGSQTIKLRFTEFREGGRVPTACMRVTMEPRAEQREGGDGIPEIYRAYLVMESDLPLVQRLLWQWRTAVLLFAGMVYFVMGTLLALLCSLPLLIPKLWPAARSGPFPARI